MKTSGSIAARLFSRAAIVSLLLALGAVTTACGGAPGESGFTTGVGPGAPAPQALTITTTTVPAASVGATYSPTQLLATGASGIVSWNVVTGATPPGMTVTDDGMLFGTPTSTGFYSFTVQATDSAGSDVQMLGVSVDTFGAYVESGLTFGEAWTGNQIVIAYEGAAGTVTATTPVNGSGGSVISINPSTRKITYVPGPVYSSQVADRITVTDTGSGNSVDIDLTVRPNPLENHIARFGTTDVWKLDFDAKNGSHAYATDWHAGLARLGLRNPASTGAVGTEADQLCDMVARIAVLEHLNQHFLRNPDGSAGEQGLAISFPYEAMTGYSTPAPSGWVGGQPYVYNTLALCDTPEIGAVGRALVDSTSNVLIENNSPGAGGVLGTFVNRVVDYVAIMFDEYGTQLLTTPVNAGDLVALRAMLFDTGSAGARYPMIEYMVNGLAQSVAAVCGHEIGHSLGLHHTNPTTPGSIMNYALVVHEQATYHFVPSDLAILQQGLPGPGRVIAAAQKAVGLPDGGLCSCDD